MKRLLLTLALFATVAISYAQLSSAHLAAIKAKIDAGQYKAFGNAFPNSPTEVSDWQAKCATFRANTIKTGTSQDATVQLWRGYAGTVIDPPSGTPSYPITIGEGVQATSTRFALYGDVADATAVRLNLLAQARMPAQTGFVGARFQELPPAPLNNNGSTRPSSFSFQNECHWLQRLGQAYLLTKATFTPIEQVEFETWYMGWANYLESILKARFAFDLPNMWALDLSVRRGVYADNFSADAKVLWYENGIAGPRSRGAGQVFGNIYSSYLSVFATAYAITGQTHMLSTCRAIHHAWLFFSVYANGRLAENVRNGDYSNPAQGAIWYGGVLLHNHLYSEWMLRTRKATMLDISTTGGNPDTRCATGQPAKSLKLALQGYLNGYTFVTPLYNALPASNTTAIKSPYAGPARAQSDDYCTWYISVFGMAGALYNDATFRLASAAKVAGMAPISPKGHSAAGMAPRAWNGPANAMQVGVNTLWRDVNVTY